MGGVKGGVSAADIAEIIKSGGKGVAGHFRVVAQGTAGIASGRLNFVGPGGFIMAGNGMMGLTSSGGGGWRAFSGPDNEANPGMVSNRGAGRQSPMRPAPPP